MGKPVGESPHLGVLGEQARRGCSVVLLPTFSREKLHRRRKVVPKTVHPACHRDHANLVTITTITRLWFFPLTEICYFYRSCFSLKTGCFLVLQVRSYHPIMYFSVRNILLAWFLPICLYENGCSSLGDLKSQNCLHLQILPQEISAICCAQEGS